MATETPGRQILENHADPDVARFRSLSQEVRRAVHKTHAFVRFFPGEDGVWRSFHQLEHPALKLAAPFFVDRFRNQKWEIHTPTESASWDLEKLTFGPAGAWRPPATEPGTFSGDASQEERQGGDSDEVLGAWSDYYASIFNPARLNLRAMRTELPVRHWKTLPELRPLAQLVRDAPERVDAMRERAAELSRPPIGPERNAGLEEIRAALASCRACPLYEDATQAVAGVGPANAKLVLVGEQPGDAEDRAGTPFVGPAGQLLREMMAEVGTSFEAVYFTNAVKHFKHETRGKARIHKTPSVNEARSCRPFLELELRAIRPAVVVALGVTAARSVFGNQFKLSQSRGRPSETVFAAASLASWHPAAILRTTDEALREKRRQELRADLELSRRLLESSAP